ncbi:glycosyltransferase family 4 protein [Methanoregula sp.]|uniref:glycosyltransferase family 4 protein n=1 Tax=Methanoregula sp. TaxID=2052170 RepID=UPI003C4B6A6B
MKIAVVTPAYPPHQGGLEITTQILVEALRERGHEVRVYSPGEIRHSWSVFGGADLVRSIRDPPDIFHVQQCDLSVRYAALLKKKYPRVPVVTTVHGMFRVDPFGYCRVRLSPKEPLRQFMRIIPGKYYEAKSVRATDYVITVSNDLEQVCKEIRKDTRVVTIANGISLRQFRQKEFVPPGASPVILCPGRIYAEKGQIFLLEALPEILKHFNASLYFVGDKEPGYFRHLVDRATENDTADKISFMGAQKYADMPGIYQRADIVVAPSLSETFGMAILENMAMGNVVVASDVGGIPNLIDDGINGLLVEPQDPHALAAAIIRGLTDRELRQKIWENAARKAAMFDIQKTAENVEKIYRMVL